MVWLFNMSDKLYVFKFIGNIGRFKTHRYGYYSSCNATAGYTAAACLPG
jgi:hypothetical protein